MKTYVVDDSKDPSVFQWWASFELPKHMFKLMDINPYIAKKYMHLKMSSTEVVCCK